MNTRLKAILQGLVQFLAPPVVRLYARRPVRLLAPIVRFVTGIQMAAREIQLVAGILRRRGPCNYLVFGVGRDSPLWQRLNAGGRTVFLEDIPRWLDEAKRLDAGLEGYRVVYTTERPQWRELLDAPDRLALALPAQVERQRWDVILVDAPAGNNDTSPGRMQSIYVAARLASGSPGTDVLVHDCHREVERAYSDRFLGAESFCEEVLLLRHYRIAGGPDAASRRSVPASTESRTVTQ